jgi:hypothetical protein
MNETGPSAGDFAGSVRVAEILLQLATRVAGLGALDALRALAPVRLGILALGGLNANIAAVGAKLAAGGAARQDEAGAEQ